MVETVQIEPDDELRFPRTPRLGEDYWLAHCEGYAVERDGHRLGVVENVVFESEPDRPEAIRVLGGVFGNKLQVVDVDEVEEIDPREERLTLRPEPRPAT
jgi:hypothetical protein